MAGNVKWHPQKFIKRSESRWSRRLDATAIWLTGDITGSFKKGNVTGKTPSAPGEIPAVVTGRLKGSIMWDAPTKLTRRIGSTLKPEGGQSGSYAMYLEYGTPQQRMKARPWARPALARNKKRIAKMIKGK